MAPESSTKTARAAREYLRELWRRREFAWYMAMGNLRSRNASTTLGLFWWVLNPLLMGGVYFVVFGLILNINRDLPYLLSGVFVFYYTSTSVTSGANSIIQNKNLLVNLQLPKLIMPITAIVEAGVGFLTSIPALYLIIGLTDGIYPSLRTLWLFPAIFAIHSVFNLGLATFTARFAVPFRDITNVLPHVLRIWFYLSPILYTVERFDDLPEWAAIVYNLNPMVHLLAIYRAALLGSEFEIGSLVAASMWAVVVVSASVVMFVRYEGKMARYL